MKFKNLFSLLVLFFIFYSCKEEINETTEMKDSETISFINDRIVFSSSNYYEKFINTENNVESLKATSKLKNAKISTLNDTLYGDFLKAILNNDKIVQIGNWIIKVDLENDRISVLNVKDSLYVENLKNDASDPRIYRFTTSDEVIPILNDPELLESYRLKSTKGIFCKDRWADRKKDDGFEEYGVGYRLDCKVVYQKAGIYFSLQAKVKNQTQMAGVWVAQGAVLWMNYQASWSIRCGKSGTASQTCTDCYHYDNEYNARVYENVRALEHYSYTVRFAHKGYFVSRVYSISD